MVAWETAVSEQAFQGGFMANEITMPQLSDTMFDGTILSWLKKEGDEVEVGEALAEVATDKADLEIESFYDGTLLKIFAPEGTKVNVGEIIAVVGEPGEEVGELKKKEAAPNTDEPAEQVTSQPEPVEEEQQVAQPSASAANGVQAEPEGRIKASPLAKNLAQSHGINLATLSGSGEGGRIVKRDVESALGGSQSASQPVASRAPTPQVAQSASRPQTPITPPAGSTVEPLSSMRQAIATRMAEATSTIPHFYLTTKIIADSLVDTRRSLKSLPEYEGITFNHLIIKAAALALKEFPRINSCYKDGNIVTPGAVNVGIITAVEDGLLIPVLKQAEQLPLIDIVGESNALVQRARVGRPKGEDLMGATFCISNVGKFAVESFTAVISPGNGAILAVGAIEDEPVAFEGELAVASVLRVTLSVDHRIIDGVMGAQFLTRLKELLENPIRLLA